MTDAERIIAVLDRLHVVLRNIRCVECRRLQCDAITTELLPAIIEDVMADSLRHRVVNHAH